MKKRLFAGLLTLVMILSLVPMPALAVENEPEVVPCTVTEGCTLADGHDGDCVLPDEPEEPTDGDENNYCGTDDVTDSEGGIMPLGAGEEGEGETTFTPSIYCGATDNENNVTWKLTKNGDGDNTYTLTISGTGAMADYKDPQGTDANKNPWSDEVKAPWYVALKSQADETTHMVPITQIVVGDGITGLGDHAFAYTSVTTAEFKSNVKDYGDALYYCCQNLTTVNWDNFYPENITDGWVTTRTQAGPYVPFSLFDGCKKLTTCTIGETTYDEGTLVLPAHISAVCTAAFRGTGFDTIDFSDGLKNITAAGPYAFAQTAIREITIPSNIEFYHQKDNAAANTFNKCGSLESVTIQDTGTTIVSGMFSNCAALKTITGGDNIDTIETTAFQYCDALTEFNSNSVQTIGSMAFLESGLQSLSLGEVGTIGASAFLGCDELKTVSIVGTSSLDIPANAFDSWKSNANPQYSAAAPLESFKLENGTLPAFTSAAKATLTTLELGDGVKNVPASLCYGATKLTTVSLGKNITSIGNSAFRNTAITEIEIPDSVTSIGSSAFNGCTDLAEVTISKDSALTTIGGGAFQGTKITNITIPSGVTSIGSQPFFNSTTLVSVDMSGVLSKDIYIGPWCFTYNSSVATRPMRIFYVPSSAIVDRLQNKDNCNNDETDKQSRIQNAVIAITNGGTFDTAPNSNTELADPIKDGSIFKGWYTNEACTEGSEVTSGTTLSTSTTYYANWSDSSYSIGESDKEITLDMTYGETSATQNVTVIYNGNGTSSIKSVKSDNEAIDAKATDGNLAVTIQAAENVNAGTYSGTVYITTGDEATLLVTVTLNVDPKTVTKPLADTKTYTYDGSEQTYQVAESTDYTVTGNKQTNAGSYSVTVSLNDKTNTKWADGTTGDLDFTFTIEKGTQQKPDAAPTLASRTTNSITLDAVEGAEYQMNGGTWQSNPTFTGLSSGTAYTFAMRYAETSNCNASEAGPTASFSTSSSGSNSSSSSYSVNIPSTKNGTVTASPRSADKNDTVTLTVKPNSGYELADLTVTDAKGNELKLTDKGNGKYTFTMPAGKVTVDATFAKIEEQPKISFVDVSASAYYYDAVEWAVENGVTSGTSATTFSPDAACTRAQMVTFLWRAAGSPAPKSNVNPFTDVLPGAYYYDAVLWAVEQGITVGTTTTTFSPDDTVTRGQTVTFLHRAAGSPAANGGSFADVAADAYYAPAVQWAVANGITYGTSSTTFSPDDPCTRGQIVTFLYRDMAE